jgi:hypothetical protein
MDSLNFHPGPPSLPFYFLRAGYPSNDLTAISGVTRLQVWRPAAVFYPFRHPTPYAYE